MADRVFQAVKIPKGPFRCQLPKSSPLIPQSKAGSGPGDNVLKEQQQHHNSTVAAVYIYKAVYLFILLFLLYGNSMPNLLKSTIAV